MSERADAERRESLRAEKKQWLEPSVLRMWAGRAEDGSDNNPDMSSQPS